MGPEFGGLPGGGYPEEDAGQDIADHAEKESVIITSCDIVDIAAQPGAKGPSQAHSRKQETGNSPVVLAVEQVSSPCKNRGRKEPTRIAEADGIDIQEPRLGGILNGN